MYRSNLTSIKKQLSSHGKSHQFTEVSTAVVAVVLVAITMVTVFLTSLLRHILGLEFNEDRNGGYITNFQQVVVM